MPRLAFACAAMILAAAARADINPACVGAKNDAECDRRLEKLFPDQVRRQGDELSIVRKGEVIRSFMNVPFREGHLGDVRIYTLDDYNPRLRAFVVLESDWGNGGVYHIIDDDSGKDLAVVGDDPRWSPSKTRFVSTEATNQGRSTGLVQLWQCGAAGCRPADIGEASLIGGKLDVKWESDDVVAIAAFHCLIDDKAKWTCAKRS